MDQDVVQDSLSSKNKIKGLEKDTVNLLLGVSVGLIVLLLLLLVVNYFNIISLSSLYPKQLGWLPHRSRSIGIYIDPNTPIITIDNKVITYREYNNVEYVTAYALKDKKKARERAQELFIMAEILRKEALNQNKPFQEKEFVSYLTARGYTTATINNNPARRLEEEIAYLKNQLASDLTWYTGEYFLVRFENDLAISTEEKKTRAKAKLEEIKQKYATGVSFRTMMDLYRNDKELNDLNQQQGFGNTFEKMTLERPQVTAPELLTTIQKLKVNQISDTFVFSDPKRMGYNEPVPFAYAFVKLTDYHYGIASSFDTWYEKAKQNTKIIVNNTVLE